MERLRTGKIEHGRQTFQTVTYHLLVDVIPTLLLLIAMAFGMALVSYELMREPQFSESESQIAKIP